ncbi:hypothetical protein [Massilia polaris]|uniref:hypothetical protein n=1 Tax=Massilia polaris TaxID=2728846 RepID=UPI001E5D227D|nr:hypothetical protein [Massilia polaris]
MRRPRHEGLAGQQQLEFVRQDRLAEQEALHVIAVLGRQPVALVGRFDAFGDDFQAACGPSR